jgi:hypothetical protein
VDNLPDWMQADIWRPLPGRNKDRSTFDWQIAKECARAGLKMADYIALYRLGAQEEFASKWREKEMNRPGTGDEYLARTYAKAKIAAEKEGPLPEKPELEPVWQDDTPAEEDPPSPVEVPLQAQFDWIDAVRTCKQIRNLPEEPTEFLIFPWLQKGAIHCVHGPSGAGKSYFIAHQLFGLARGRGIGPFTVKAPAKVLYIDCEMGGRTIRNRMRGLERSYGYDEDERFMVWSPFFAPRGSTPHVDLLDPETQQNIVLMVKRLDPEVIVIDNARACTDDLIENDADGWKKLNRFWLKLREEIERERTVVWVHHDNKAKEGRTYAGNTTAITVSEVVVPLTPLKKAKVVEIADQIGHRTGGEYTVRHGIEVDMSDSKVREKDPSIHEKWTLIYKVCREDEVTQMEGWSERDGEPGDMTGLSKQEQAWFLTRFPGGPKLSNREAAERFDPKISYKSVERWAREVGEQEAIKEKVRKWAVAREKY